ncbi:MAG: hypothetical protein RL376_1835 [Verrucomicrobiota bacterium]|jgi:hypothetical protein
MTRRLRLLALFTLIVFSPFHAMSAPSAFPATAPGVTELKTLPAGLLVRSEAKGDYFKNSGDLFRPLFLYIQRKDIAMTTPVEAHVADTSAMYFWIATSERAKAESDLPPAASAPASGAPPEGVVVLTRPERLVISHGARGSYSRGHFEEARAAALAWLAGRTDLAAEGEAYAVYWNSPFMPGFLKRYEIHLPVRKLTPATP